MHLLANFRQNPHHAGTTRIIRYYPHDSGTTQIMWAIPAGTNLGLWVLWVWVKPAGTRKKNPLPITTQHQIFFATIQ